MLSAKSSLLGLLNSSNMVSNQGSIFRIAKGQKYNRQKDITVLTGSRVLGANKSW